MYSASCRSKNHVCNQSSKLSLHLKISGPVQPTESASVSNVREVLVHCDATKSESVNIFKQELSWLSTFKTFA